MTVREEDSQAWSLFSQFLHHFGSPGDQGSTSEPPFFTCFASITSLKVSLQNDKNRGSDVDHVEMISSSAAYCGLHYAHPYCCLCCLGNI